MKEKYVIRYPKSARAREMDALRFHLTQTKWNFIRVPKGWEIDIIRPDGTVIRLGSAKTKMSKYSILYWITLGIWVGFLIGCLVFS